MNLARTVAELEARQAGRRLFREYAGLYNHDKPFGPDNVGVYSWQADWHNAGKDHPEKCLLSANQVGKSRSGGAETAMHLCGHYPDWWDGRRFDHPVVGWTGAERTEDSKDIIQHTLLGPESSHGTGWIPKSALVKATYRQAGVPEVVDKIYVKHKSGGISELTLKTYQMEARAWRGKTLDFCWLDEEPKQEIYTEAQTRLVKNKGLLMLTVTPVLGVSGVILHFMDGGPGIYVKNASWNDAPHLDDDEKKRLEMSYPEHERDTRVRGIPMLGTGAIFPIADDNISIEPFEIPHHFARINGIDFGIDHPGAGAFCAWDRDSDTFYIYDVYKKSGETAVYHADAMKKYGKWIPNAWPHDGLIRDKGSGVQLRNLYKKHGLFMLKDHARYQEKEKAAHVEPGLIEMLEYMRTGRFKVFSTCSPWFEEKRLYHRKDGKAVALNEDILSASRYAFVMRRMAITKPYPVQKKGPRTPILGMRRWKHAN